MAALSKPKLEPLPKNSIRPYSHVSAALKDEHFGTTPAHLSPRVSSRSPSQLSALKLLTSSRQRPLRIDAASFPLTPVRERQSA